MKKQFLTVILILLLLVSWVVIIDLARDLKDKSNALKIAEKSLDELCIKVDELSTAIDTYERERIRGNHEDRITRMTLPATLKISQMP